MSRERSRNWVRMVPFCTWVMNSQVHTKTGFTPSELFFGRPNWIPNFVTDPESTPSCLTWCLEQIAMADVARERLEHHRMKSLKKLNRRSKPATYVQGDLVLVHRKRFPQWTCRKLASQFFGPYRITKVLHGACLVKTSPKLGGEVEVAFSFLKRFPNCVLEDSDDSDDDVEIFERRRNGSRR